MKKFVTLLLAAGLIFCSITPASAVDFKIKGMWQLSMDYASGGNFMSQTRNGQATVGQYYNSFHLPRDNFWAGERINLQLDAIASENLSGTLALEIGDLGFGTSWGGAGSAGAALGADATNVIKVKWAYLDWAVPSTDLRLRMGIQPINMPGIAFNSPILQTDGPGLTANYRFNENASVTLGWWRPFNDNWAGSVGTGNRSGYNSSSAAGSMDNFDLVSLIVPLRFEGVRITPWFMGGAFGPNFMRPAPSVDNPNGNYINNNNMLVFNTPNFQALGGQPGDWFFPRTGLYPAAFSSDSARERVFSSEYTPLFWGGLSGEIIAAAPFRFAWDLFYGSVSSDRDYLKRAGWYGVALAEYKLDWGTPGLYAWYATGDDSDPNNGSERMPYMSLANNYGNCLSSYGFRGTMAIGGGKGIINGMPDGLWGVGLRLNEMSFLENLKHTFRIHYFGGTNNTKMASYITGRLGNDNGGRTVYRNYFDFNSVVGTYLTTADTGIELNFDSFYKVSDNLTVNLELGYIKLWMDNGVWGRPGYVQPNGQPGGGLSQQDAWKISFNAIYAF